MAKKTTAPVMVRGLWELISRSLSNNAVPFSPQCKHLLAVRLAPLLQELDVVEVTDNELANFMGRLPV
jgi:hypothetical protein